MSRQLAVAIFALTASTACRDKECTPEDFDGTLFLSDGDEPGTVSGTATWPDSVEEGSLMELGLEWADGFGYVGALSDGGWFDQPKTCGTEVKFTIKGVPADEYQVFVGIQSGDGYDTGDMDYVVEGRSDVVTIDGKVTGVKVVLQ